jgi:hypothetical protein
VPSTRLWIKYSKVIISSQKGVGEHHTITQRRWRWRTANIFNPTAWKGRQQTKEKVIQKSDWEYKKLESSRVSATYKESKWD